LALAIIPTIGLAINIPLLFSNRFAISFIKRLE
jgi:hypothetical protein